MLLPSGISGFFEAGKCADLVDSRVFKQVCYCIANDNNGKLLSLDISLSGKNFYMAKIEIDKSLTYLLMNAYYHYIAFASLVERGKIVFRDYPTNLRFSFSQYKILDTKELSKSCLNAIDKLSDTEIAQIKYWKPTTIGDIIFNFWD